MHTPGNDFLPRKVDHPLSKSLGGGYAPSEVLLRARHTRGRALATGIVHGSPTKTKTKTKTKFKTKKTTTTKTKTPTKAKTNTNTNTNTKTQTKTHSRR